MKVSDIAAIVDELVPLRRAQEWDNVGLLVGRADKAVRRVMLAIDVTAAVVDEARRNKIDLILSYHPIIWDGLKQVLAAGPTGPVHDLIRADIPVLSIHTAFDVAEGGVNDQLADMLGIVDPRPIGDYVSDPQCGFYKLVTFVPVPNVEDVAQALFEAGAGHIGRYACCSFRTPGEGTFLPLEGARPAIGRAGRLERVDEVRLEAIIPEARTGEVLAALRKAHPYETPAFDVLRHHDLEHRWGLGRMGSLARPMPLTEILAAIRKTTGARAAGLVGPQKRTIRTAAVCAGSCGKLLNTVIAAGCDLYVTGELKHHMALAAQEAGLTCVCLSHSVSERFALKKLAARLKRRLKDVTITHSRTDADPFVWKPI